jgi:hypothetical protein
MDDCQVPRTESIYCLLSDFCIDLDLTSVSMHLGADIIDAHEAITDAETTGGGFPGWVGNIAGSLRTNNAAYAQGNCRIGSRCGLGGLMRIFSAWTPYMTAIAKIIARNQITNGGPSKWTLMPPLLVHINTIFVG